MKEKIYWQITAQSLRTDAQAKKLEHAILADCPDADVSEVRAYTVLLSCTKGLDFNEVMGRPALHALKRFIASGIEDLTGAALWDFRQDMATQLWYAWVSGFNQGQELFQTDPAELPSSALSEDQKEEAETPNSPLA